MTIKSISAGDFVQRSTTRQNIISPFLPERGLAEIYAKTGVGKATFALSLCAASTGKHFFEWEVRRPWKVLYIDGEMSTHGQKDLPLLQSISLKINTTFKLKTNL